MASNDWLGDKAVFSLQSCFVTVLSSSDEGLYARNVSYTSNTVEPLYNGHLGAEITGRCREVAVVGRFQLE